MADIIYHYTTLNALVSILSSNEKYACLRFTRIDYLNDSDEFIDYDRMIKYAFFELDKELPKDLKSDFDMFREEFDLELKNENMKKIFTMSFSNDRDSIPMWNYYSDSTGISIGFDKKKLIENIEMNLTDDIQSFDCERIEVKTLNMIYDENKKIGLLKEYIKEILQIEGGRKRLRRYFSVNNMNSHSKSFKNKKFEYENEYRICLDMGYRYNSEKIKFQATGMNIKPYFELKLNKADFVSAISEIVVSPLNNSSMIVNGIHEFLSSCGCEIDIDSISKSDCTLRCL